MAWQLKNATEQRIQTISTISNFFSTDESVAPRSDSVTFRSDN